MKTFFIAALVAATTLSAQAAEVGVSVQISQPGVYGRIDIGRFPQPQLVVSQPVIIVRTPVAVAPQPVYMWVPVDHRKNWKKHCGYYNACGAPVYFVRDDWYGDHVNPKGRGHGGERDEGHDGEHDEGHGKGKGKGKGHGKHD